MSHFSTVLSIIERNATIDTLSAFGFAELDFAAASLERADEFDLIASAMERAGVDVAEWIKAVEWYQCDPDAAEHIGSLLIQFYVSACEVGELVGGGLSRDRAAEQLCSAARDRLTLAGLSGNWVNRKIATVVLDAIDLGSTCPRVGDRVDLPLEYVAAMLVNAAKHSGMSKSDIDNIIPDIANALSGSPIERQFKGAWERVGHPYPLSFQHPVGRYFVDFAHVETCTAIELDGFEHHSSTIDIENDRRRQREIEDAGWSVIRFGGREVHRDADACARAVAARIARASGRIT